MNLNTVLAIVLLITLGFGDNKPQGYKVVLNTFSTLKEASARMDKIVLSDRGMKLKEKYGFEIVSRPSGKSYIIAVEPIGDEQAAKEVLSHFQTVFKDAYKSGYYGPTAGSVLLASGSNEKQTHPTAKSDKDENVSDTNEANSTHGDRESSEKSGGAFWFWIVLVGFPVAGALGGVLMGRFKRRNAKNI